MGKLSAGGLSLIGLTVIACVAACSASATTLEVSGFPKNSQVSIIASLASGTSLKLESVAFAEVETCTTSELKGSTSVFSGTTASGSVSSFTLGNCTHTTTVLKAGTFTIGAISGTTNGTITFANTEVTVVSTALGISQVCKSGAGTYGSITGVKSGNATIDISGTLYCGAWLPETRWIATYSVTSPTGLGVVS
jgi:hypothetical protein